MQNNNNLYHQMPLSVSVVCPFLARVVPFVWTGLQECIKRLTEDNRHLSSQLHRLTEQVGANTNSLAQRHASADAGR